jgi:hypothetical protein
MSACVSPCQNLLQSCPSLLELAFRRLTTPSTPSLVRDILSDLTRSKAELIVENALLCQQLVIMHRHVRRPRLNRRDRFWLVVLVSRVANWKHALMIIQPGTLLRR